MTDLTFSWRASGDRNDPSGVATFSVGYESVDIGMNNFAEAGKLLRLIEKASDREQQRFIDRALISVTRSLNDYRHDWWLLRIFAQLSYCTRSTIRPLAHPCRRPSNRPTAGAADG